MDFHACLPKICPHEDACCSGYASQAPHWLLARVTSTTAKVPPQLPMWHQTGKSPHFFKSLLNTKMFYSAANRVPPREASAAALSAGKCNLGCAPLRRDALIAGPSGSLPWVMKDNSPLHPPLITLGTALHGNSQSLRNGEELNREGPWTFLMPSVNCSTTPGCPTKGMSVSSIAGASQEGKGMWRIKAPRDA